MAASPALLSLTPAVSRHPHLLFSPCPPRRHVRLAPLTATPSSPGGTGPGGPGVFLSPRALSQLDELAAFRYEHAFPHGLLTVRALRRGPDDDAVAEALVRLLASSFSETVRWAPAQRYAQLLTFVIRRYLHDRRGLAPHAAVLVGFYRPADADADDDGAASEDGRDDEGGEEEGEDEGEMACTAEVSFDAVGAPGAPPTPTPPLDFPYICNMTVKTPLRRRGIGKQLLKACEDLVFRMNARRRVYLHCRIIDQVPFNMYRKAGYIIVQTDSILVWLSLQKRKYLMSKELPQASVVSETSTKNFDDNI
ncbi:GCN5-related N-acetyltransferase 5, chloroplastic [Miscanthus floridulus]|uniref:GCN5-related N-acetyltransferase 5, chloroplastic n=1 Tax=Miscanthus floridulus TaxID=154761 RepID=UPI0034589A99